MRISQMLSILFAFILINVALATFVPLAHAEDDLVVKNNGSVIYDQGQGEGDHIFFYLNETSGQISDLGINTSNGKKVLLDNISLDGFVPSELMFLGSLVKMSDENASLTMHDNPTGLTHAKMKRNTVVNVELAGDLVVIDEQEVDEDGNVSYQLVISDNMTRGLIISDRPFDVLDNGTVIESECTDLMVRFLPHLDTERGWMEAVLMEAIEDGRISAEVILAMGEEGGESDVVPYNAMLQVEVRSVQENRFHLRVAGENPGGVLLLIQAQESIMEMVEGRLRVNLADAELRQVGEPMVLLYEHPEEASYAVIDEDGANQMLIYLPANMLGEVIAEGIDPWASLLSPVGVIMTTGSVALVLLAGFVVFRRR